MKGAREIFIDNKSKIGILMIHGFSSTPVEFRELGAYLSDKGFNVLAPLVAGHGTSPEDFMKTSPKDWTKSVTDAYLKLKSISEKVFVVGDSFGANLAFWLVKESANEQDGIITLSAPIFLRHHKFILFRMYSYGWFKRYYHKPRQFYKKGGVNIVDEAMLNEATYPKIPIRNLRQLVAFVKKETIPELPEIKIPVLVIYSDYDPVVHPRSANYIYRHVGSSFKKIYHFKSDYHEMIIDENRPELFREIYGFIEEVIKTDRGKK